MSALAVLSAAAVIASVRIGLREADRDEADTHRLLPRIRVLRSPHSRRAARLAYLAHAGFVALGVASLLVMLLALAASLAG